MLTYGYAARASALNLPVWQMPTLRASDTCLLFLALLFVPTQGARPYRQAKHVLQNK